MMISMRYARNLAEGHGLVWNPGDRVEGYTNFLWTVVMAGVHLLPVSDANMSLAVKVVGFGLMGGSFWLSLRLLRLFAPRSWIAPPLLFVAMLACVDIVHWAAWGFETSLLTLLLLGFLVCRLEERAPRLGLVALALIPLTRADGIHVFVAGAIMAMVMTNNARRTAAHLAAALVPFGVHVLFRHAYYGDWLPNTYYLKVYGLDDTFARGAHYVQHFLLRYAVLLTLAAGSALAILRSDRRGFAFFAVVLTTLGYVVTTGGDMFGNFRFFAHVMPIVFVFAAAGVARVVESKIGAMVWAAVLFLVSVPLLRPLAILVAFDTNGDPYEQLQVAMLMKKNARPDSSVAVITAGILPYFTRMKAVDILGKSDKHIAKTMPFPGAMVGHGKQDPTWTVGLNADLVVSCRSHGWVMNLEPAVRTTDPVLSFLASTPFQRTYRSFPIQEDFLLGRTAVYTRSGSPEMATRTWIPVVVTP